MSVSAVSPGGGMCSNCQLGKLAPETGFCPTCWYPAALESPIRRRAQEDLNRLELERRYRAAAEKAQQRGIASVFDRFEKIVNQDGKAVLALYSEYAANFFASPVTLYSTYQKLVAAKMRTPAASGNDKRRRIVDAILFNGLASEGDGVFMAAVSLDGRGLPSYGDIYVEIAPQCIAYRCGVLEENCFRFVERHKLGEGGANTDIPLGYYAVWEEKGKLAAIKHVEELSMDLSEDSFCRLLLRSDGDREKDEFMEVHVYGNFNSRALIRAVGRSGLSSDNPKLQKALSSSAFVDKVEAFAELLALVRFSQKVAVDD